MIPLIGGEHRHLMIPDIRVLTLWPEWAYAIAHLGKDGENRPWRWPAHLVGQPLLIHAGTRPVVGRLGYNRADQIDWWRSVCRDAGADAPPMCDVDAVRGHIVAMAVPDDSYDAGLANSRWAEDYGWWTPLYDVRALPTPIPYRGGQGLRRAPPELVELVLGQVAP